MKRKKYYELNDEMLDKIISVAYKDAGLKERIEVYRAASVNEEIKNLLKSYKETAKEVHEINEEEYPEELMHTRKLVNLPTERIKNYFLNDLIYIVFARPIVTTAVSVILIGALITALVLNRPVEYRYSESEIRLADKQAKYALALVGKIFNDTKITLNNEIFQEKIGRPIQESFGIVNKLFNEQGDIQ